ncbi:MAG: zinc-ribbon domain containing protein [Planctomycetes bacterium]|nr:zinc-ribbon domain containing protein [Planctomycetota bacterium]
MKYKDHPRFGYEPRVTGLNPGKNDAGVYLHWHNDRAKDYPWSRTSKTIPNTAISANPKAQVTALFPVTHYFDLERICIDCEQHFLFFAMEQMYWYEQLHFPMDAECVRCAECRSSMRTLQQLRLRYEELVGLEVLSEQLEHELTEARLVLIEQGVFSLKQADAIGAFFNRFPDHEQVQSMRARLRAIPPEDGQGGSFVKGRRRS